MSVYDSPYEGETEEATLTYSEHERLMKLAESEQINRQFAIEQARKLNLGHKPELIVSAAGKFYAFLTGTEEKFEVTTKSSGVVANADGSLINWIGENYVRQSESQKNYRVGAEDRQRLVLKRVREMLRDEYESFETDQTVTVTQAYRRVKQVLDNANWEF